MRQSQIEIKAATEVEDHSGDNPVLSVVIERNIRTIIQLRQKAAHKRSLQDRIADTITSFSGRMLFAYVHIVWFIGWKGISNESK